MSDIKNIVKLKERRTERFEAFMERISALVDMANDYNIPSSNELLADVLTLIKDVAVKEKVGNGTTTTNYYKWLNVKTKDIKYFVDKIINGLRDAHLDFIERELINTAKSLKASYFEDAIDDIEEFARPKYEGAVRLFVHLAKIKKLKALEAELFEINKDITACIKYNDTIANQLVSNAEETSSLSDEFIENAMMEEEVEV